MSSVLRHERMSSVLRHELMSSVLRHERMSSVLRHELMSSVLRHERISSVLASQSACITCLLAALFRLPHCLECRRRTLRPEHRHEPLRALSPFCSCPPFPPSLLPPAHPIFACTTEEHKRQVKPHVHAALDQQCMARYIYKAFVFPGKRLDYLGNPVIMPSGLSASQCPIPDTRLLAPDTCFARASSDTRAHPAGASSGMA